MGGKAEVECLTYTVREAATAIGVCPNSVYELIRSDRLPTVTVGKRRFVPKNAVVEFIANGGDAA